MMPAFPTILCPVAAPRRLFVPACGRALFVCVRVLARSIRDETLRGPELTPRPRLGCPACVSQNHGIPTATTSSRSGTNTHAHRAQSLLHLCALCFVLWPLCFASLATCSLSSAPSAHKSRAKNGANGGKSCPSTWVGTSHDTGFVTLAFAFAALTPEARHTRTHAMPIVSVGRHVDLCRFVKVHADRRPRLGAVCWLLETWPWFHAADSDTVSPSSMS